MLVKAALIGLKRGNEPGLCLMWWKFRGVVPKLGFHSKSRPCRRFPIGDSTSTQSQTFRPEYSLPSE